MKAVALYSDVQIYQGDCLEVLGEMESDSVDACVTSPPYMDARPDVDCPTPEQFGAIFHELRRVVSGGLLLNVGRRFDNNRELLWWVDLINRANLAGWWLRDTLIWVKLNANPIRGALLADSHEMVFLFGDGFSTDDIRTEYTPEAVARMGRAWRSGSRVKGVHMEQKNRKLNPLGARPRSFFQSNVGKEKGNPHPTPMAPELAEHLVKLATPAGGTIIDPFGGSGNTAIAARLHGRNSILIEIEPKWAEEAAQRLAQQVLS